jgi:hypothetical protein
MNSFNRYFAVVFTLLITAGFTLSGFHFHDERNPDAAENEVSIVHELDYCLLCEGISSEQPSNPVSAEGFLDVADDIIIEHYSSFSPLLVLIQNSRAPPVTA